MYVCVGGCACQVSFQKFQNVCSMHHNKNLLRIKYFGERSVRKQCSLHAIPRSTTNVKGGGGESRFAKYAHGYTVARL